MANSVDIVVPDLGEFSDVEVIEILVAPGDRVEHEDGLITLETDKAAMDVPAPYDGVIDELSVALGDRVSSGSVIGKMTIDVNDTVVIVPAIATESGSATTITEKPPGSITNRVGRQALIVPDIGDFENVEVIEIHISAGDSVDIESPLATLETDKAAMDVPAVVAGTIVDVLVKVGDKVSAGSTIATIDATIDATVDAIASDEVSAPAAEVAPAAAGSSEPPNRSVQSSPAIPAKRPATRELPAISEAGFARAHASPSVRKLARELGVDLARVKGSGLKDRILHDDVKAFVKSVLSGQADTGTGLPKTPSVDFSKFGEIEVQPLTRIQKISGPRLQASWINLPHVTQHDEADITELEQRRQALKGPAKERGIPLTPLAFVIKACVTALKEFPTVNSSLSEDGEGLVLKHYCHIGFAADTEQGLMVPVIRDADKKDVYELATDLKNLSAAARDGKLKANDLQGATFTISSLGGIGGTAFTPIVNAPEVAILGVSRSSMQPVWDGEQFQPRLMLPLSLSYDHRVVDGALAVRFTTYLSKALGNVDTLLQAIP